MQATQSPNGLLVQQLTDTMTAIAVEQIPEEDGVSLMAVELARQALMLQSALRWLVVHRGDVARQMLATMAAELEDPYPAGTRSLVGD